MELVLTFLCALLSAKHVWTVPTNTTFNLLKDMHGSNHHVDSVEAEQRAKAVADGRLRPDVLDSTEDMSLVDSGTSLELRMSSSGSSDTGNVNLVHTLWSPERKMSEEFSSGEFPRNSAESAGLRCYNCSYHGDAFEGLPSHNECLLDPGNGLIAVAHATTVPRGLQAYCAVATLPDASNEDIIRLAIVDHPNLSGTCKQVDVSLLCYCDTDLCNGPRRPPDDASAVVSTEEISETQSASSQPIVLTFKNETEVTQVEQNNSSGVDAVKSCQFPIVIALYLMGLIAYICS